MVWSLRLRVYDGRTSEMVKVERGMRASAALTVSYVSLTIIDVPRAGKRRGEYGFTIVDISGPLQGVLMHLGGGEGHERLSGAEPGFGFRV